MKKNQHNKLLFYTLGIAVFTFALTVLLYCAGAFSILENKTYDNRMNALSRFTTPNQDIIFIGIDQSSLDEGHKYKGWSWPWPREAYANVVEFMNLGGAQSVAFDVLYTEPSIYGDEDDQSFADANSAYGRTILVMSSTDNAGTTFPIQNIRDSAGIMANVTSIKDRDGMIRRARISLEHEGASYPTLGVATTLLDSEEERQDIAALYETLPYPASMQERLDCLYESLPMDSQGAVRLRYKGSIDRYAHYRAIDVIRSLDVEKAVREGAELSPELKEFYESENFLEPGYFEDATVFFLFYAPGLYDICSTPISEMYPGAGCHITLLDNLLEFGQGNMSESFIRELPLWVILFYLALWAALSALIVYKSEVSFFVGRTAFLIASGSGSLIAVAGFGYGFFVAGILLPIVAPLFCFGFSLWLGMLAAHSIEGRQKKFIQGAFSQYLSPSVIENLISNPQSLKLGGEKRNISIFFSDIQSFTTLSESLTPEKLTEVLNQYLTAMTDMILASGGTIDKYEGDAIIAFWNAPTDEPDHARRAVETAVRCQEKLEEMKAEFVEKVGRPLSTRIGLNTGDAIVGNMGSSQRFDYTMLGDAVNLASRLEGINKQFGTYLMVSKETKEQSEQHGTELFFRELGRVAVVGKSQAVTVFEPMTREAAASRKEELDSFANALALFYEGKFAEAKAAFGKTARSDPPAEKYSAKCDELIASPPESWQGVWKATSK